MSGCGGQGIQTSGSIKRGEFGKKNLAPCSFLDRV